MQQPQPMCSGGHHGNGVYAVTWCVNVFTLACLRSVTLCQCSQKIKLHTKVRGLLLAACLIDAHSACLCTAVSTFEFLYMGGASVQFTDPG